MNFIIFGENKGGKSPSAKKSKILGQQKFLADGVAGGSKNRPSNNFGHIVLPSCRNCNFNQKQKSYPNWKLCNAEKSKIMVPPFGTQCPISEALSWDGYLLEKKFALYNQNSLRYLKNFWPFFLRVLIGIVIFSSNFFSSEEWLCYQDLIIQILML